MYSPEPSGERDQSRELTVTVPHKGHLGGRKVGKRMGKRVLLPKKPLRQPLLTQAGHQAGPSDSEVMPGRKATIAVPQGTSCLSV